MNTFNVLLKPSTTVTHCAVCFANFAVSTCNFFPCTSSFLFKNIIRILKSTFFLSFFTNLIAKYKCNV